MNIMALESPPAFQHAVVEPSSTNAHSGVGGHKRSEVEISLTSCPSKVWISGDYDSLPEVPMCYPIERTSTVLASYDPSEIAKRVLHCLQMLSITAKCNSKEVSLFADTLDYTKFFIRMYKHSKGILVELQRVDGDSFNFIKHAQAILASARGEDIDERKATRRRSSLTYIPASILPCHLKKAGKHDNKDSACIMHVEDLLSKDRSDAILLGIESLLLLTDKERSQVSLSAAEAVLTGNGHAVIKEFIVKCIHCPQMVLSQADNAFDYDSRQCKIIHNAALAILGNSLETAMDAEHTKLSGSLLKSEEWIGHSGIVNLLLSELSHAEDRSHDAYHAARCLNALVESSPEMKWTLIERGLPNAMKVSQTVGQHRHSLLALECDAALTLIADA